VSPPPRVGLTTQINLIGEFFKKGLALQTRLGLSVSQMHCLNDTSSGVSKTKAEDHFVYGWYLPVLTKVFSPTAVTA
jgi:hypothetical protein